MREKDFRILFCIAILASALSGCALFSLAPYECEQSDTPNLTRAMQREVAGIPPVTGGQPACTKSDFLKSWGMPDRIEPKGRNSETWIWERRLWCGYLPVFLVIPVPLMLPVCTGYEKVEFRDDSAQTIQTRTKRWCGIIGFLFPGIAGCETRCSRPAYPDGCYRENRE